MKKTKRILSAILTMMLLMSMASVINLNMTASAANASLADLQAKFPQGKYWNHYCSKQEDTSNYCRDKGYNCYDETVSDSPCWSHSVSGYSSYVGHYDCNRFSGATQCCGFAKKISYLAYGSICTNWNTKSLSSGLKPGDVIWCNSSSSWGHWVMVIAVDSNGITVGECNYSGRCRIDWTRYIKYSSLSIKSIYNAPWALSTNPPKPQYEIDTSYPTPFIARTLSTGKVTCYDSVNGRSIGKIYPSDDVTVQEVYTNGWVKGSCPWTGGGYKTIFVKKSVFINSSNAPKKYTASQKTYTYLRSSDSSSWGWIDPGDVCYSIYKSGNRTMVLYPTSNGKLRLAWTTNTVPTTTYSLDLNSSVDGTKVWDLNGIGTADVYVNGSLVANDCSDFCKSYAKGTTYKITDIRAKSGYTYTGSKTISGTLNGNRDITLTFKKTVSGWSTNFRMKAGAYMNAYDGVNGSKVGRVYPNDVVTVKYVYNSGWMQLVCPWSDSNGSYNRTVYCQINGFQYKATKYCNAYDGVNGNYVGRVYPNDIVTVKELYSSGWMKCVCPWTGNTNKTIFVKLAEIY